MSKKAKDVDTTSAFAGDVFEPMTREQIESLDDTELAVAFASAADWLAGQFRGVTLSPEWRADNPNATDQEIAQELHRQSGDPLEILSAKWNTPGKMRVLLRRAAAQYNRRKAGGKAKAMPVTVKGTKTEVETGPLTRRHCKAGRESG